MCVSEYEYFFLSLKWCVIIYKGFQVWSVKWIATEMKERERGTQTNTNIPTGWEQASPGNKNGSGGNLMAGARETGLEVGAFMHNGPWEAPFSPVAGPFTGSSSPALKRTPHASPLPRQSTFLSHHFPNSCFWVAFCHYLDSFTAPCLWRAWFC